MLRDLSTGPELNLFKLFNGISIMISTNHVQHSHPGVLVRIEGKTLSEKQLDLVMPILQQHHDGKINHQTFVRLSLSTCKKANLPIITETKAWE